MSQNFYKNLTSTVNAGEIISLNDALRILDLKQLDTFELLQCAYHFRKQYFGNLVTIHILNNVQNGMCPEDCRYCAQSSTSSVPIQEYRMKSDEEILSEAAMAYAHGAGRYCMVFSGTGPSDERINHLTRLIREIKQRHNIEVCVSPGVINASQARKLKEAGLDRLNHNLNTSKGYYHHICTSHGYSDRLRTLKAAHSVGLAVCSGVIIGMGEGPEDVYEMAKSLHLLGAESIPVNFLIPMAGIALKEAKGLTPAYCLRVLCLFRFLNPKGEIRMAAGREIHLRSLEALGLYAANSLFLQGYLNVKGAADLQTLAMINDLGFSIKSDMPLEQLLSQTPQDEARDEIKNVAELRPFQGRK